MSLHRSRIVALGLLLGALVVGGVAGAAAGRHWERTEHRREERRRGSGRDAYVERLTLQLDLSVPQQEAIRGLIQRWEPKTDSVWRLYRPRFDSLRHELRDSVRAQLTPDQLRKYSELLERRDREYRNRRSNGK